MLSFLLSMVILSASPVFAADRYGMVSLQNRTRVAVTYQLHWGNGQWKTYRIEPGGQRWHSWKFKKVNEDRNPPIHIKFDSDFSGRNFWIQYHLTAYASPDQNPANGKLYVFQPDGSNRYVDLKVARR